MLQQWSIMGIQWVEHRAAASYFCSKNTLSRTTKSLLLENAQDACVCPPPSKSPCSFLIAASRNAARWQFYEFDKSSGKRGGSEVRKGEKKGRRVGVKKGRWGGICKGWISILFSFREILSAAASPSQAASASTCRLESTAAPSDRDRLVLVHY